MKTEKYKFQVITACENCIKKNKKNEFLLVELKDKSGLS